MNKEVLLSAAQDALEGDYDIRPLDSAGHFIAVLKGDDGNVADLLFLSIEDGQVFAQELKISKRIVV